MHLYSNLTDDLTVWRQCSESCVIVCNVFNKIMDTDAQNIKRHFQANVSTVYLYINVSCVLSRSTGVH